MLGCFTIKADECGYTEKADGWKKFINIIKNEDMMTKIIRDWRVVKKQKQWNYKWEVLVLARRVKEERV